MKTMVLALGAVLTMACGPAMRAQDAAVHAPTAAAPSANSETPAPAAASAPVPAESGGLSPNEVQLSPERLRPLIVVTAPKDWTLLDIAGLKNKGLATTFANDFRPNFNIVEEVTDVSWEKYLSGTSTGLAQAGYKTEKPSDFQSEKVGTMKRFVGTVTMQNRQLVQHFYIHKAARSFFVLTCSRVVQNPASLDEACDAIARSFRIVD